MTNPFLQIAQRGYFGFKNIQYKSTFLTFMISLYSIVGFSQLTVNNAELCGQFTGMALYATGADYIENNSSQTFQLYLSELPDGSVLEQGMYYDIEQTLDFSQEGEYVFILHDDQGLNFGTWIVESFFLENVSAGSSSFDICPSDTVALVGSLPYDNQGNLHSYYFLEWTQIDDLPAVEWESATDVQIAYVTNFQEPGTYTFEYTLNPGTNCSSSDSMTVTVVDCDIVNSVAEIQANLQVYPTLVKSGLHVSNTYRDDLQLVLYDQNGRQVKSERVSIGVHPISTQSLSEGMYVYRISDRLGQSLISGKVIVL